MVPKQDLQPLMTTTTTATSTRGCNKYVILASDPVIWKSSQSNARAEEEMVKKD
jgi:hypothetical protein